MPFTIVRQDITKMQVDAIVNAANTELQMGGGVCGAIFRQAGPEKLQAACNAIGFCEPGHAVITPGFDLKARHVIHTVGPVWEGGSHGEEATLRACYRASLQLAVKHELQSIAFPLISAGIYGYPRQQALQVASEEISAFLTDERSPDLQVTLVLFDNYSYREAEGLFGEIASYLDRRSPAYARANRDIPFPAQERLGNRLGFPMPEDAAMAPMSALEPQPSASAQPAKNRLKQWIADRVQREETFSQCLLRLIDESGEKDATVYKRANVDRRLFSKIRSNTYYQPGKSTVLAFCLALRLSLEDSNMLLAKAGYALTPTSQFDLAVEYCLAHRIYDVHQVNIALFELDLPLLGA